MTLVSTTLKKGETQLRYVLLYTQIRLLDHQLTEGEQTVRQSNHILDEGVHVMHDIESALIQPKGCIAIESASCIVNLKFQNDQYFLLFFLYILFKGPV